MRLTIFFFALSFYCFGAGIMDGFVIYDSWRYVGEADFASMHQATSQRIISFFVLPTLLMTVVTVAMFWYRPPVIPKRLFMWALTFQTVAWLSSAFIQIPMQTRLSQGKNDELLQQLISSDWIRVVASIGYIIVVIQMIYCLIRTYKAAKVAVR